MVLESDALRQNLRETAVNYVLIDARYDNLLDAVRSYQGVFKAAEHIVYELHHPFVNWAVFIEELRSFSLKHLPVLSRTQAADQAIAGVLELFYDTIANAPKQHQKLMVIDGLMAFYEKMVTTLDASLLLRIIPVLKDGFSRLHDLEDSLIMGIVRSLHPLPKIISIMLNRFKRQGMAQSIEVPLSDDEQGLWQVVLRLLIRVQELSLTYWIQLDDPAEWFDRTIRQYSAYFPDSLLQDVQKLIHPISRTRLQQELARVSDIRKRCASFLSDVCQDASFMDPASLFSCIEELVAIVSYLDIVKAYRTVANSFGEHYCALQGSFIGPDSRPLEIDLHILFLFHMVELDALSTIHEEVLRNINKRLLCLVRTAQIEQLNEILPRSFQLLKQQIGNFPQTALQCIEALGGEIYRLNNESLLELFLEQVVEFGFQTPDIHGVDAEWHVLSNPAHIQNIRVWLKLIRQNPKVFSTLLSALIVNLSLGGTCIKDTDLFQKDVTQLLNADIEPVYALVKQFAKLLPVYFNEIGAEGILRDVSTELDELTLRQDKLIHFLRKQAHVESHNLIVDFISAIMHFWYSGDKSVLQPWVPDVVLETVTPSGEFFDDVHRIMLRLTESCPIRRPSSGHVDVLENLCELSEARVSELLAAMTDVSDREKKRVELLFKMYRLEVLKYRLGVHELLGHLREAKKWGFNGLDRVISMLEDTESSSVDGAGYNALLQSEVLEKRIQTLLETLEWLKDIILSPQQFEIREDIYYKRHIAVDIPSMYGKYHEKKFDALSLSFRLENLAQTYFETLIENLELTFVTRALFVRIVKYLKLCYRAVRLNGVRSRGFEAHLTLLEQSLEIRRFSFSQYLDIVRGLSDGVKEMIHVHYISPHQDNLSRVLRQLGEERLITKYRTTASVRESSDLLPSVSERFYRDLIATTFGMQILDRFVSRLYQVMGEQKERLNQRELDLLLSYDMDRVLCPIHNPNPQTKNLIHLGNKGFNLVKLAEEGLPVPPGVIATTELFRCYSVLQAFPKVYEDFQSQLRSAIADIERKTGKRFGDRANPLLLSVRSGAAISMPGMMATIINVGMNQDIAEGLAASSQNSWFAWDNYRRFLQSWGMAFGLEREIFTELMVSHKRRYGVSKKREFSGDAMRELALLYREAVLSHGREIEDDPFEQLLISLRLVLGSWDSPKAKAYRGIMEISDYWGTAVIMQAMAFGNISERSGTGVVFTANPSKKLDRVSLWGDFTPGNQGEDIVSGLVLTYPISKEQKAVRGINGEVSLEETFPDIYAELLRLANYLIYEKKWSPQEIEFTFEGPTPDQLYILQTRNMAIKKHDKVSIFVPSRTLDANYLARGIGVSGGAMSGKVVFNLADIERFRAEEPDTPLILVRSDTVPEDIREISLADGLLTARGGQTSHAAIVAFRLDKVCVVGCKQLKVYEDKGLAKINELDIHTGDYLSIDGRLGMIYWGKHKAQLEKRMISVQ